MKTLYTILLVVLLGGCTMLSPQIEQAAEKVQEGVDRYCAELSDQARAEFRKTINPTPGGATIVVTCP